MRSSTYLIGLGILFSFSILVLPRTTSAIGVAADLRCQQANCTITGEPNKVPCQTVVCEDQTNGFATKGFCATPTQCKAVTGGGQAVGLDLVMKALGDLFGKLMQQPPPSPTAPPPTSQPPGTNTGGCLGTYFDTSDVSQLSNPCARYVPPTSTFITPTTTPPGGCSTLDQLLGQCPGSQNNCPAVPMVDCAPGNHLLSGGKDAKGCVLPDTCVPDTSPNPQKTTTPTTPTTTTRTIFATTTTTGGMVVPTGGARGDINVRVEGATVVGGTRDTQNNVEVAGFYGSETFGGQGSQGLVGAWCKARPWASNFLSKIVAPSFFDGLCTWRGFQVGTPPPPTPAVVLQQTPKPKPVTATTTVSTSTASTVPPKVDIWAVPTSVPIGARTSIFWNTQGVTNCTETSPNGGFNQSSLSGGAATQPITAATTFTISCLAPDGSHVTGSVTVNLKI